MFSVLDLILIGILLFFSFLNAFLAILGNDSAARIKRALLAIFLSIWALGAMQLGMHQGLNAISCSDAP